MIFWSYFFKYLKTENYYIKLLIFIKHNKATFRFILKCVIK